MLSASHRWLNFAPTTRLAGLGAVLLVMCLSSCTLAFSSTPTATSEATAETTAAMSRPIAVWVEAGDLFAWTTDDTTPQLIAESGVISAYLAPDGKQIAFTRGADGEAATLWVVGSDGTGAREVVHPGDFPARGQGHPEIAQVAWLDAETIYFSSRQRTASGVVDDENLYRVQIDLKPQLILPPGAGGNAFSISPDGAWIAVVHAGVYADDDGRISVLDPLGARVREALTFTAIAAPSEAPITPPLAWSSDGSLLRVPILNRDDGLVTLWKIPLSAAPPNDQPAIFGVVDALPDGLPAWGTNSLTYLQASASTTALVIADANRNNASVYDSGHISDLRWLADGERFVYRKQDRLRIGKLRQPPKALMDAPDGAIAFAGDWVFFVNAGSLNFAALDGSDPQTIAPFPEEATLSAGVIS